MFIGNPEQVLKTFQAGGQDSDLLSGGGLLEEQQTSLVTHVRNYTVLMADIAPDAAYSGNSPLGRQSAIEARLPNGAPFGGNALRLRAGGVTPVVHRGGQISGIDDQLYAGGTVLGPATEAAQPANAYDNNFADFGRRRWELSKLRASYAFTTEFVTQNVAGNSLNGELERIVTPILAQNLEDLNLNGDSTLAADGSARRTLLRTNDGWRAILRAQAPKMDLRGEYAEPEMFYQAVRRVPPQYNTVGRVWMANDRAALDWTQHMLSRGAGALESSLALIGQAPAPCGFQWLLVPLMPNNLALPKISNAIPAFVSGNRPVGGSFTAAAFQITINVDGSGAETIVFPTVLASNPEDRYLSASRIAQIINDQYSAAQGSSYSNIASVGQDDVLELRGVASNGSIVIAAPANSALSLLGLTAGTYNGAGASAGGTNVVYEGSEIIFGDPAGFRFHYGTAAPGSTGPAGLRQYMKFSQSHDKYLYDMYLWTDATIADPEAYVFMQHLRIARPGINPVNP